MMLAGAAASVIAGLVLGLVARAGLGRRGQFYGAMMGGMIFNMLAKIEGVSYLTAAVLMGIVTAVAFGLSYTTALLGLFGRGAPPGVRSMLDPKDD